MTLHRLFNIILLLALIPTIAVSGILTTTTFNGSVIATGFTGLEFNGATYDGQFVYDSFNGIRNSIPKINGTVDITERFPFFGDRDLTSNFVNSVNSLLIANSASFVSNGSNLTDQEYYVPYRTTTRIIGGMAVPAVDVVFADYFINSTNWIDSLDDHGAHGNVFYLIANESVAESSSAVPEPSSLVLILFCIAALAIGRKRFAEPAKSLAANT